MFDVFPQLLSNLLDNSSLFGIRYSVIWSYIRASADLYAVNQAVEEGALIGVERKQLTDTDAP